MDECTEISFDTAIKHILKDKSSLLYSFVPTFEGNNKVVGGTIYTIEYEHSDDYESDSDCINITYLEGSFYSSSGEEDYFTLDDLPEEAKKLKYRITNIAPPYLNLGYELNVTLKRLVGLSPDEALSDNPCPECDQLIFKTGQPNKCDRCKK